MMASGESSRLRATLLRPPTPIRERAEGSLLHYDLAAPPRTEPQPPATATPPRRWTSWLGALLLYLGAAVLLLLDLGGWPAAAYNWEVYSARGIWDFLAAPNLAHFAPTDGLMTDSGHSPLVVLPVLLSWRVIGASLFALRLPIALIAAAAVPLCWLVGRRFVGRWSAALGAVLLALSGAFLVYGRTATIVGVSLVPALLAIWLLARAVEEPSAGRLALLQLALFVNGWAYAPLRFLWLIALAAFVCETLWRRGLRRRFALATLVTLLALPLFLYGTASWVAHRDVAATAPQPLMVLRSYFNGRGEQVFAPDSGLQGIAGIAPVVKHNAGDMLALFFDRDTRPALLDYWNTHGRLQLGLLVPFVLLGLGWTIARLWRSPFARLHLLLVAGFALPILFTSNVHIGRLIYVVPLLSLLAARGVISAAEGIGWSVARLAPPARGRWSRARLSVHTHGWRALAAGVVVLVVSVGTWRDYTVENPLQGMVRGEGVLRDRAPELAAAGRTAVILTNLAPQGLAPHDPGMEIYALVGYRLDLDRAYRFVDLDRESAPSSADPRALALLGGDPAVVLDREGLCGAVYFAPDDVLPALRARTEALGCAESPEVPLLQR